MRRRVYVTVLVLMLLLIAGCAWLSGISSVKRPSESTPAPEKSTPKSVPPAVEPPVPQPVETLKLTAVGDIMLSFDRASGKQMAQYGYKYPFEDVKEKFENSDIVFANMESPIAYGGKKLPGKGITFRTDPMVIDGLLYAGIDVVSLANNHILDYDDPALLDTLRLLKTARIHSVGAGSNITEARTPAIIEKNGLKVAFLAYTDMADIYFSYEYKKVFKAADDRPGVAPLDLDMILEDVRATRPKVDVLIVSLHWGVEDSNETTDEQMEMAHKIIDAGANAILGHHPHVLQGIEIYKGKPIVYSLGNFIFDQLEENNKQSMILELDFENGSWIKGRAYPVYMQEKGHPIIEVGEQARTICNKIIRLSKTMGTTMQLDGDGVVFDIKDETKI